MEEFLFYIRFGQWLLYVDKDAKRLADIYVYVVAPDAKEAERIAHKYFDKKFEMELKYTGVKKKISDFCYDIQKKDGFIQEPPVALKRNVLFEKTEKRIYYQSAPKR